MRSKQLLELIANRLDAIERNVDRIELATLVREPGNASSVDAYSGLRKQVIAATSERTAHLAQLSQVDVALRDGVVAEQLAPNLRRYGQFHLHYLPKNFWAMWLAGPQWDAELNFWKPDSEGMSLLLTTPALIYLARAHQRSWVVVGAWIAFGLLLIPLLLYYNTGWWQFGYRFSLDFMTPVMVLLAVAVRTHVTWSMRGLILVGTLVNLYGVLWWHL